MKPLWSEIHRAPADQAAAEADGTGDAGHEADVQDRTQSWSDNGKDGSLYDEAGTASSGAETAGASGREADKTGDRQ